MLERDFTNGPVKRLEKIERMLEDMEDDKVPIITCTLISIKETGGSLGDNSIKCLQGVIQPQMLNDGGGR